MKLIWLDEAKHSFEYAINYIALENLPAAFRVADDIEKAILGLLDFPYSGRLGRVPETRELIVTPYVIAYQIKQDHIEILQVLHAAQEWPEAF